MSTHRTHRSVQQQVEQTPRTQRNSSLGVVMGGFAILLILGGIWLIGLTINPGATTTTTVGAVQTGVNGFVLVVALLVVAAIAIAVVKFGAGNNLIMWKSSYHKEEHYHIRNYGSGVLKKPSWMDENEEDNL